MNKIEYALKLAKDCTYADEMTEGAKEFLRKAIDEALTEVLPQAVVSGRSEQLCFCGQKLETKVGDNRAWRECNNGHEQ